MYRTFFMTDHYATLGVTKTSTPDEIKRAYRKLASQHHPDKGGDTAQFQRVEEAYRVLSDPAQRQRYDSPPPNMGNFNFQAGQNIHDIFGQMFGGANPFAQQQRRSHLRMTMWIRLVDVLQGGTKTVQLGSTQGSNTVEVAIPQGIEDGDNVQYGGIAPGNQDLVIQFRITPEPNWRREHLNLHTEIRVPVWKLILGSELTVNTLANNQLTVTMPAMTQPNTVMRIRQHGIRNRDGQQGDIMVRLIAEIPANIHPEVLAAIQQHHA
jgi:DnaJ-class molecular chaperone